MPQVINANLGQTGMLADRIPASPQLLQRLPWPLPRKHIVVGGNLAAPSPDICDELQRWRAQRQPMFLALLGVAARLDPESRLGIELRPGGEHRLAGTAAGQHNEPDAVGRRRAAIGVEAFDHCRDLGRAQEALLGLLRVALDALAGIALRLVTPRLVLARHRLEG